MSPQGTFGTSRLHSELWDWGVKSAILPSPIPGVIYESVQIATQSNCE